MQESTAQDWRTRARVGLAIAVALFVATGVGRAVQDEAVDLTTTMGRGRACTQWFYGQEFAKIEELGFTEAMREALPSMGGLAGFWETVETQLGGETEVVEEVETQQEGLDLYLRTAKFENYPGDIVVQWVFDGEGAIAGMSIRPKQ